MSKSKSKAEEARQFLDDLDNLSPVPPPTTGGSASSTSNAAPATNTNDDPADVLKFIDEITLKSSEPTRPASRASLTTPTGTIRKATERVRVGSPAPPSSAGSASGSASKSDVQARLSSASSSSDTAQSLTEAGKGGGWGWGSVWSSASAALQQARTAVDEGVKHLPSNEQAMKWREEVMSRVPLKKEQLEKLGSDLRTVGFSTLTDILNAVAPPISEHEVIQVWCSHDMEGYEGVESLVYKALSRVMEQVEGGDLVVNKGKEFKPRDKGAPRNMNAVEGLETALRLAEANVDELIKTNPKGEEKSSNTTQIPTTYSSVYLRIQPFITTLPTPGKQGKERESTLTHLQFALYLSDPEHQLVYSSVTQAIPASWLDHWDAQDWIEDVVVESLRVGVETIGQEYIVARMGWIKESSGDAVEENTEVKN